MPKASPRLPTSDAGLHACGCRRGPRHLVEIAELVQKLDAPHRTLCRQPLARDSTALARLEPRGRIVVVRPHRELFLTAPMNPGLELAHLARVARAESARRLPMPALYRIICLR